MNSAGSVIKSASFAGGIPVTVAAIAACRADDEVVGAQAELGAHPELAELNAEALQAISRRKGINFATSLLFERVTNSPRHAPFIRRIEELRARPLPGRRLRATVAIAPGAFYREFPHTGADGQILVEQAKKLGAATCVIPTGSTGTLADNARQIVDWLTTRPRDEPIILGSVSKGGSDIKLALAHSPDAFHSVVAWINVCGILSGSPMVNWLRTHRLQYLFYRLLFLLKRLDFGVIGDLNHGVGAPLDFDLALPPHLKTVHVIGFPLEEHLTNRLARTCHSRIADYGPNDGAIVLADACAVPGLIYPVWGSDHYMRPVWELRTLAGALLTYLGDELNLFATADEEAHRRTD
jgi:hypothetical protein